MKICEDPKIWHSIRPELSAKWRQCLYFSAAADMFRTISTFSPTLSCRKPINGTARCACALHHTPFARKPFDKIVLSNLQKSSPVVRPSNVVSTKCDWNMKGIVIRTLSRVPTGICRRWKAFLSARSCEEKTVHRKCEPDGGVDGLTLRIRLRYENHMIDSAVIAAHAKCQIAAPTVSEFTSSAQSTAVAIVERPQSKNVAIILKTKSCDQFDKQFGKYIHQMHVRCTESTCWRANETTQRYSLFSLIHSDNMVMSHAIYRTKIHHFMFWQSDWRLRCAVASTNHPSHWNLDRSLCLSQQKTITSE